MKEELGVENPLMGNWWRNVLIYDGFAATEYGIPTADKYQADGVFHIGAAEEGYRGLVGYYNMLYTEGLLDPNFMTTDEGTSQASLLNGSTGVHPTSGARINKITARSEDPEFKLVGIGSLNGSDGTRAMYAQLDALTPNRINAYITADCKQPELAVAFFNWLYTNEGIIASNYGVEGLTYEYNEEGKPIFTEFMTDNPAGEPLDNMLYLMTMQNRPRYAVNGAAAQRFNMPEQRAAMEVWDQNDASLYILPSGLTSSDKALADEAATLWTDLDTYIKECAVKFISGEMNLDGDFDAYIEQLKDMNIDRYIEIMQGALDEYYSK